jgi:hypothetical protein
MSPRRRALTFTGLGLVAALVIATGIFMSVNDSAPVAEPATTIAGAPRSSTSAPVEPPIDDPVTRSALVHSYGENRAFPADALQRGVVVANPWYRDQATRIDNARPATLVLAYKNVWAVTTAGARDGSLPAGLSYETVAARPSFQLRDQTGKWLQFSDYPNLWQANAGDAAYQRAWVQSVLADLGGGPFDGVFLDDLLLTADAHHPGVRSPVYPTDTAIQAATRSFVAAVVPALRSAGLVVVGNITGSIPHAGVWDDWLGLLDGAMEESFAHYATGQFVGDRVGEWSTQIAEIDTAVRTDKTMIVHTEMGSGDDTSGRRYAYASYMLASGPNTFYSYGDTFAIVPEMRLDLGQPVGSRTEIAAGVWARAYENGMVVVNPSASKHTVTLPAPLRVNGSGSAVTKVTLDATRAVLLLR